MSFLLFFFPMILDGYFEGTLQASWGKKEEEKGQKSINFYAMPGPIAGALWPQGLGISKTPQPSGVTLH